MDTKNDRPVVLFTSYSLRPGIQGKKNTTWKFLMQIARFNKVVVVTRRKFKDEISRFISKQPIGGLEQIEFRYFDTGLPGGNWQAVLWQYLLPGFVKREGLHFDVIHHMSLSSAGGPAFLRKLKKPLVWGPHGFQPRVPRNYLVHVYGWKAYLFQESRWWLKKLIRSSDPLYQKSLNNSDAVLTLDEHPEREIKNLHSRIVQMPLAGNYASAAIRHIRKGEGFTVLSSGRFLPQNGFDLTIRSFARFYHTLPQYLKSGVRLVLIGEGPAFSYLENLVNEMELGTAVQFIPWMHTTDLQKLYSESDVFLYGGHQGRCDQLSEALSMSLPVVCFKEGIFGSHVDQQSGITIPYGRYDTTLTRFAEALRLLYENNSLYTRLSEGARNAFLSRFSWETKGEQLNELYQSLLKKAS